MTKQGRAILLWLVVSLMMVLHFFLLLSVGVITSDLRSALDLTALQLSFLSSSYLYIYLILQTPAGILLDEFGARKILTIGSVVASIGCWVFARSDELYLTILARILTGGGLAFVFVASVQLASRWFAKRYFGMMIGFSEAAGMLGAIIGNMLLAVFINQLGWRESYILAACFALILAAGSWVFIRDYPDGYKVTARSKLTVNRVIANIKILAREPQIWLQSAYIALMYETITVFSGLWANPFLRTAFDLDLQQSTFACSLVLAGIGIGSPIAGVLCDTDKKKSDCISSCAILMFALMSAIVYIPHLPYWLINLLMFALGVSGSSLILSFAIVSDVAPEGAKSTSVGLTNSISLSTAIVFQPVIGWVLNLLAEKRGSAGLEYYSAN
ncbi:MAG TPA: MFS transporter, partial [Gammaproteobacteria bacterium]|nr:MFS transporter [Gammaproteobacteria bacterium]